MYSLFHLHQANRIIEEVRFTHSVFGGFITGKLLDSLIIGVICFFCMRLLRMPYVLLISVIIGVSYCDPVFGPFIGAIPSAFLDPDGEPHAVPVFCAVRAGAAAV